PQQNLWLDKLDAERSNFSAALEWCRLQGPKSEAGLKLAGLLSIFWQVRGYLGEGRWWLEEAFLAGSEISPQIQAKAWVGAGMLAYTQSDYDRAIELLKTSFAVYERIDDKCGMGATLNCLGTVSRDRGRYDEAYQYHNQALALHRLCGDTIEIAESLNSMGLSALYQAQYDLASERFAECKSYWEQSFNTRGIARVTNNMGLTAYYQSQFDLAIMLCRDSLKRFELLGDKWGRAITLVNLSRIALEQGQYKFSLQLARQSLTLSQEINYRENIAECLEALANTLASIEQLDLGAKVLGYANRLREKIGAPLPPSDKPYHEHTSEILQRALGDELFKRRLLEGSLSDLLPMLLTDS
ncbi:MAG TPA: tetratricopeptide repeat protein, partial [Aggregatilineales bacterium]|nr:tetratricopeptide repeat protein [Aggregatilineales bacterium]